METTIIVKIVEEKVLLQCLQEVVTHHSLVILVHVQIPIALRGKRDILVMIIEPGVVAVVIVDTVVAVLLIMAYNFITIFAFFHSVLYRTFAIR